MEQYKLTESEYRFATIIWEREPIQSGELVTLCAERLGWKKSTTYTVLKTLCEKGIFCNDSTIVTSTVPMERVQRDQSRQFLQRTFEGSLPRFVASFLGDDGKLDNKDLQELRALLDSYEEDR